MKRNDAYRFKVLVSATRDKNTVLVIFVQISAELVFSGLPYGLGRGPTHRSTTVLILELTNYKDIAKAKVI